MTRALLTAAFLGLLAFIMGTAAHVTVTATQAQWERGAGEW
jgi:hypothetical protein